MSTYTPAPGSYQVPGYEDRDNAYRNAANTTDKRTAPMSTAAQIGGYERAGGSDFAADQRWLLDQLRAQALGQGPSLAKEQLRLGADQNVAAQQALAATGRGNAAMAARQAAQNTANINQNMAGQAALAGIQERLGALGQIGGVAGQARGQDQDLSMFNADQYNSRQLAQAGFNQQTGLANQSASLQQGQMNDQRYLELLRQALQQAGMQQGGNSAYEQALIGINQAGLDRPSVWDMLMGAGSGLLGSIF